MTLEEYTYDGAGRRIQLIENSETTTYIYAGFSVLFEENTTGFATYIYGPKGRLTKRKQLGGNLVYFTITMIIWVPLGYDTYQESHSKQCHTNPHHQVYLEFRELVW